MSVHATWGDWFVSEEVEATTPEGLSVWCLGCNGFVLRTETTTVYIDPYFGDGDPLNIVRMVPVPIDPADATLCDAVLVTREHIDHVHAPPTGRWSRTCVRSCTRRARPTTSPTTTATCGPPTSAGTSSRSSTGSRSVVPGSCRCDSCDARTDAASGRAVHTVGHTYVNALSDVHGRGVRSQPKQSWNGSFSCVRQYHEPRDERVPGME